MALYCYRSQVNRLVEANSLTDSYGAPLCGRNFEDDDFQLDRGPMMGMKFVLNILSFCSSGHSDYWYIKIYELGK